MVVDGGCVNPDNIAVPLHPGAEGFQNLDSGVDVPQERHVAYFMKSGSQKSGNENGK